MLMYDVVSKTAVALSGVAVEDVAMPMYIAIDPGVSIGVAIKYSDGKYITCTLTEPSSLWEILKGKPDKVAFESFRTGGRVDVNMLHTIELVGSIRGICYVLGVPSYGQLPQSRKSFLDEADAKLKDVLLHTRHEVDALAHLLLLEWRIANNKL